MLYSANQVVALLRHAAVTLSLEDADRVRAALPREWTRGTAVLDALRALRRRHPFLDKRCVCERRRFDRIFAENHLERVKQTYDAPEKTPADLMYLANAFIAAEGTHELFVQIGDDYSWVEEGAFRSAVDVLLQMVPHGEYERSVCAPLDPPVAGARVLIDGLAGSLDVCVEETTAYELKFVRELTREHELQGLLYAAILAANADAPARCVVLNARTGETVAREIDPLPARALLREAAHAKAGVAG
jgi:hypothetical protein